MEMKEDTTNTFIATTGERFLYEDQPRHIFVSFSVKEKLDVVCLRQAADAMMERCPYFHTKAVFQNGRYHLAEQKAPVPVLENDGCILTTDERSDGFLLVISYSGNTVYICAHHALSDGRGVLRFARSFAAEYVSRAMGKNLHVPQELRPEQAVNKEEYEDPNKYIIRQRHPFQIPSKAGFMIPNADIRENTYRMRYCVPTDSILRLSKDAESSFSAVLAMMMNQTIDRVYPAKEKPAKIYCPVEVRQMLGCPENMQNCVCGIDFDFPDDLKKMPFYQQLSCLKGMLMLRTSEEYLLDSLEKKKISHAQICKNADSYEKIKEHYNQVNYSSPMLTYMKTIDLGDIAPYIEDFDVNIPVIGSCGFDLVAYCIGDRCLLNLISRIKPDELFDAFEYALSSQSIPYRVLNKEGFGAEDFRTKKWLGE